MAPKPLIDDTPGEAVAARKVSRRWPLISGIVALVIGVVMGVLLYSRQTNVVFAEVDGEWAEELFERRFIVLEWFSFGMNALGGGIIGVVIVPLAIAVLLLLLRRPWAAGYFVAASIVSALVVQIIKGLVGRPRPELMLVESDFGSFPSGHAANAATIVVALAVIFPRVWVWAAGLAYALLMAFSRTYLGVHWLSDTIGGLLLGAGVALILWTPVAARLQREPRPRKLPT